MKAGFVVRSGLGAIQAVGVAGCGANGPEAPPSVPSLGAEGSNSSLLGTWLLVSMQEADRPATEVADPSSFQAEGRVHLVADCNLCSGGYTAGEGTLSVTTLACTRAACPSMPLDTTYAGLVGSATAWTATADRLELRSAAGMLRFRR
jgi:heat shock protein HslJ